MDKDDKYIKNKLMQMSVSLLEISCMMYFNTNFTKHKARLKELAIEIMSIAAGYSPK